MLLHHPRQNQWETHRHLQSNLSHLRHRLKLLLHLQHVHLHLHHLLLLLPFHLVLLRHLHLLQLPPSLQTLLHSLRDALLALNALKASGLTCLSLTELVLHLLSHNLWLLTLMLKRRMRSCTSWTESRRLNQTLSLRMS